MSDKASREQKPEPELPQGVNSAIILGVALVFEFGLAAAAWYLTPILTGSTLAEQLAVDQPSLTLTYGLGGGLAALLAVLAAYSTIVQYRRVLYEHVVDKLRLLPPLVLGAAGVGAAVGEELFFRGLLLPWIGLVPSSLLFGLLHVSSRESWLYYGLTAAVIGAGFGLLFLWTGSLVAPMIAHAAYNLLVTYFIAKGLFEPEEA
jgi:membrane protease YdiL (CAAX protease family)